MDNSVVFSSNYKFWQRALDAAIRGFLVNVTGKTCGDDFKIELTKADANQVTMRSSCITAFDKKVAHYYYDSEGAIRTVELAFSPMEDITYAKIDARDVRSLVDEVNRINWVISKRLTNRAAELFLISNF
ncbi:MAG: hypothetical protein LBF42_04240 [Puniceicoccales bacterium]|jgi:hypothetical protein|nr:hypothetical protein [Puniceicoccales bacterium]